VSSSHPRLPLESHLLYRTASEKPRSSNRIAALDSIRETTPVKDLPSPAESKDPSPTPYTSPRIAHKADASVPPTPSSLPPLPESPIKSIVQAIPKPNDVIAAVSAVQRRVVQQTQREILPHGTELVEATRAVRLILLNFSSPTLS
jgi:hypothetical protein